MTCRKAMPQYWMSLSAVSPLH